MKDLYHFFNAISPIQQRTWEILEPIFSITTLKKGEYFIEEGRVAKKFGFLTSGVIRAFYRSEDGQEYNKHFFTENNMIGGFSSLISQLPSQINQQALTDCNMLVGNYKSLIDKLDDHQDLERLLRKISEQYFVDKEKREVEIVLLDASKRYAIFQDEYPNLEQIIPQYHIASYLGITATQLSRIRSKNRKA